MAVALAAIFILPDFPETTKWLSPLERKLAMQRMEEDAGVDDAKETETAGNGLWLCLTDWKVWWYAFALTSIVVALSFNAYFPTLTDTLGYSKTVSLLLCAPPWAFATIVAFMVSRYVIVQFAQNCLTNKNRCSHSDKTGERFFHLAIPYAFGMLGFIIALSTMNTAARYIAL